MQVELVYEKSCPNIEAARTLLLHAFVEAGIAARWQEWEVSNPDAPPHIHGYGSPTILVNGRDVSGDASKKDDYCCRVYLNNKSNNKGVPALKDITDAFISIQPSSAIKKHTSSLQLNSALLPAVGAVFLPKLACPACWPAYAGLLSSMGIGFIDYTPYLLPLTLAFLVIALVTLFYRAERRYGYNPFLLGLGAGAILLIGKFQYDSDATMYVGLGLLILSSLWNTWPKPQSTGEPCPACVTNVVAEQVNAEI